MCALGRAELGVYTGPTQRQKSPHQSQASLSLSSSNARTHIHTRIYSTYNHPLQHLSIPSIGCSYAECNDLIMSDRQEEDKAPIQGEQNKSDLAISSTPQRPPDSKETPPRWKDSTLPFFVVLRDNSTYVLPTNTASGSFSSESLTKKNPETSSNNQDIRSTSGSQKDEQLPPQAPARSPSNENNNNIELGHFTPTQLHPEIRYVFEDDDFNSTVDALDQRPGDLSVIIDFDESGEKVVSYKSLSPYWQVTNVATDNSTPPSWMGQDQSSIKLLIDGTSSKTTLVKKKQSSSSVNSTTTENDVSSIQAKLTEANQLIRAINDRNEQLKHILDSS